MTKEYRSELDNLPPLTNCPEMAIHRSMFIGCGGLGFETVNLLKKRAFHYFSDDLAEMGALKFLAVDSANAQHQEGASILDNALEVLRIDLGGWQSIVASHGGVRDDWFPPLETMRKEVRETIQRQFPSAAKGCGTTRIFGRLGMFKDDLDKDLADHIERFAASDVEGVIRHREGADGTISVVDPNELYFYIVSTLGGGTGTGLFMDVAAIIRAVQERLGRDQTWHIYGFFVTPTLLTRKNPSGGIERLNANSYAALKELMHFLDGNPFSARYSSQQSSRSANVSGRTGKESLFNGVFLVDGETEGGVELKDRLQVANFISGAIFQLAMTRTGEAHFQREIDIAMRSAFDRLVPETRLGRVIKPQRPSFAAIGWSTVHIPLEEMIEYARIRSAGEIVRELGGHESGGSSKESSLKALNEFFFAPKKGAEKDRFIDAIGLSKIIAPSYWKRRAGIPEKDRIEPNTGRTEIHNLGLFRKELLEDLDVTRDTKDLLKGSREKILEYANKTRTKDIDLAKLENIAGGFLKDHLSVEELPCELIEDSRLAKEVEKALKKGPRFVLEGLEDLLEDLAILKGKTNYKLEEIAENLADQKKHREKKYQDLEELDSGIGATIRWLFRARGNIADALEEFLKCDKRCKELALQEGALKKIVSDVIPAYEDQVGKWYNRILDMSHKVTDDLMPAIARLKRQSLKIMGTSTTCEFNIDFANMRHRFYRQFAEAVKLNDIIAEIRTQGLKHGSPPTSLDFMGALQHLTSKEIIDCILKRIAFSIETARDQGNSLFRLNFDEFAGTDRESCLFWDHTPGGDIQVVHGKLLRHGAVMTNLENPSGVERAYDICNSTIWERRLESHLTGLYSHKVTHLEMRLGFAPFQLFYLKEWYNDYKKLQREGWPLHVFKGADEWDEPYARYNYVKQPTDLFELACKSDYGRFIEEQAAGTFRVRRVRTERFEGGYCRFTIRDNRTDVIEEIRENGDIYDELFTRVLTKLMLKSGKEIDEFVKKDLIPADLIDTLKESVTTPAMKKIRGVGFKDPSRLFDLAVQLHEIQKVDPAEDVFQVKVICKPKTEECHFFVEETKDNIIGELTVNEPFYERLCYKMVLFVEQTQTAGEGKLDLLRGLFPLLPPQMKEPLAETYPEIAQ